MSAAVFARCWSSSSIGACVKNVIRTLPFGSLPFFTSTFVIPSGKRGPLARYVDVRLPVEVIEPHQADHTAPQPDAFRVAAGAVDGLLGLDEFSRLALI